MKSHILIIEDNEEIRENTAEILELANYRVSTAENERSVLKGSDRQTRPDHLRCDDACTRWLWRSAPDT